MGHMVDRKHRDLDDEKDIKLLADTFEAFQNGTLEEKKGFSAVATIEEIAKQDYILTPGRYVVISLYYHFFCSLATCLFAKMLCNLFKIINNWQMLWTDSFALATLNTITCFTEIISKSVIIFTLRCPALVLNFLFISII